MDVNGGIARRHESFMSLSPRPRTPSAQLPKNPPLRPFRADKP